MAHWTVTLQSAWYISDANTRRWVTPDNSRPQVPAALLESGTTSYLRVVNLRDNGRLFLNFGTGQTGEDRADLSNQFESTGQIRIEAGGSSFIANPADANTTVTGQDAYGYTFSGSDRTRFDAFRDTLSTTSAAQTATLIIWDGQGTNPFIVIPAAPTVDDDSPDAGDTVTISGPGASVTWQSREGTSGAWTDAGTSATLSVTQADPGTWQYRYRTGASAPWSEILTVIWSATQPTPDSANGPYTLGSPALLVSNNGYFQFERNPGIAVGTPGPNNAARWVSRLDLVNFSGITRIQVNFASTAGGSQQNSDVREENTFGLLISDSETPTEDTNNYGWTIDNDVDDANPYINVIPEDREAEFIAFINAVSRTNTYYLWWDENGIPDVIDDSNIDIAATEDFEFSSEITASVDSSGYANIDISDTEDFEFSSEITVSVELPQAEDVDITASPQDYQFSSEITAAVEQGPIELPVEITAEYISLLSSGNLISRFFGTIPKRYLVNPIPTIGDLKTDEYGDWSTPIEIAGTLVEESGYEYVYAGVDNASIPANQRPLNTWRYLQANVPSLSTTVNGLEWLASEDELTTGSLTVYSRRSIPDAVDKEFEFQLSSVGGPNVPSIATINIGAVYLGLGNSPLINNDVIIDFTSQFEDARLILQGATGEDADPTYTELILSDFDTQEPYTFQTLNFNLLDTFPPSTLYLRFEDPFPRIEFTEDFEFSSEITAITEPGPIELPVEITAEYISLLSSGNLISRFFGTIPKRYLVNPIPTIGDLKTDEYGDWSTPIEIAGTLVEESGYEYVYAGVDNASIPANQRPLNTWRYLQANVPSLSTTVNGLEWLASEDELTTGSLTVYSRRSIPDAVDKEFEFQLSSVGGPNVPSIATINIGAVYLGLGNSPLINNDVIIDFTSQFEDARLILQGATGEDADPTYTELILSDFDTQEPYTFQTLNFNLLDTFPPSTLYLRFEDPFPRIEFTEDFEFSSEITAQVESNRPDIDISNTEDFGFSSEITAETTEGVNIAPAAQDFEFSSEVTAATDSNIRPDVDIRQIDDLEFSSSITASTDKTNYPDVDLSNTEDLQFSSVITAETVRGIDLSNTEDFQFSSQITSETVRGIDVLGEEGFEFSSEITAVTESNDREDQDIQPAAQDFQFSSEITAVTTEGVNIPERRRILTNARFSSEITVEVSSPSESIDIANTEDFEFDSSVNVLVDDSSYQNVEIIEEEDFNFSAQITAQTESNNRPNQDISADEDFEFSSSIAIEVIPEVRLQATQDFLFSSEITVSVVQPDPVSQAEAEVLATAEARKVSREAEKYAVVIYHADLEEPIRLVADNQDMEIGGYTYTALAFRAVPPSFEEGETPKAILEIDNIGRELTRWVEMTGGGRGANMEVMGVYRDPFKVEIGHTIWTLPALPVGISEITNQSIQLQLAYRTGRSRPGIKIRHDPTESPGLF